MLWYLNVEDDICPCFEILTDMFFFFLDTFHGDAKQNKYMQILSGPVVWCVHTTYHISTGDMLQYEDDQSPLQSLEQAAVHYASAIRLSSRDARLHFLLGVVLEEQHYAAEMYGLQRKVVWQALSVMWGFAQMTIAKHVWLTSFFKPS